MHGQSLWSYLVGALIMKSTCPAFSLYITTMEPTWYDEDVLITCAKDFWQYKYCVK